ncbi:TetR/AcrR family transcriptional regulator [Sporolactobacillus sp. KGMB 08714]|uniref:TetR/AcrR family transcriptional regulator n=1 Tax=Sporolactobacillus sp. KGMB 08714 TaxID=3064704 RepID=UPI002FBE8DAD
MSKKEDIFNATLQLIIEEGIQAVTLAKILGKAGVGSGTLYHYFSSKEQLLYELYLKLSGRMSESVLNGYDPHESVRIRFNKLLKGYLEYIIHNFHEHNFTEQYFYILRKTRPSDSAFDTPFRSALGKIFTDGQDQKIILNYEIPILIQITCGIIASIARGNQSNRYILDELKKQQILDSCWNSIRA